MKGMNNICSINQKWVREPSPDPLGDYRPSPHDIKMREIREKNISVTQPSWIIGYNPSNIGIPSINTATRVVTFYTSKGVVGSVNWNSFNKVINKLR